MQYYNPNKLSKAAPSNIGGFNRIGDLTNEQLVGADAGTIARNSTAQRAKYLQQMSQQDNPALRESFGGLYDYANQASSNLSNLHNANNSAIDTASQRGLSNLLSQYAKANAGSGRLASRQYAGAQGDIFSRAAEAQGNALLAERNAAPGRASNLANALMATQQAEDYRPRWISDQLAGLGNDSVRNYMATQPAPQAEDPSFLQQIAPIAGTALGAYLGGPVGASIGGSLTNMAVGNKGGQASPQGQGFAAAMQGLSSGDRPGLAQTLSGLNVGHMADMSNPYSGQGNPGVSAMDGQDYAQGLYGNQQFGADQRGQLMMGDPWGIQGAANTQSLGYQAFNPNMMRGW